jgi:hypothetical protein
MYYGPQCVKNGLQICLDAADKNSYVGSGTSWKDISGNGNVFNSTVYTYPSFVLNGVHSVNINLPPFPSVPTYKS